ncbi:MAG: multiubiquitin domain-containing protein [Paracoccaceae bacterium]|nr:multiubiquitin domain-containing protein [Paracoccaceae bacterium]MDE2674537.1 multiubiquitin domain-containing protein [Paracoccaceae bacterium]
MQISIKINNQQFSIEGGLTSAQKVYDIANISTEKLVFVQDDKNTVYVEPNDFLILKDNDSFITRGNEDQKSSGKCIGIMFNGKTGEEYQLDNARVSCRELKELDKEFPNGRLFVAVGAEGDIEISDDMNLIVREGDAIIVIPPGEDNKGDPIDIELCSKHDRIPPRGQRYKIRIDREKFVVKETIISGKDILALVNKIPEEWALNQKFGGGKRKRIDKNEFIDLSSPGTERFETVLRQAQQGDIDHFDILAEDKEYLNANHPKWEICSEGHGKYGLIIEGFTVPFGFNSSNTRLMVLIPVGYPATPLDMFYVDPPLSKTNGQIPGCLATEAHFGTSWQRWSRHYDWKVGEHSIISHLEYVVSELELEGLK